MTPELQTKIDRAIKLIRLAAGNDTIEVAYSGGKDSDVILELTKMAGVKYRAIYKNTTIDPPGTIAHALKMGAEIMMPKDGLTFFKLIEKHGLPGMFKRYCCKYLKEYKVLDKAIIGVRKSESTRRAARYVEPTQCKIYNHGKDHVEAIYPILEWTDQDVQQFITERGIQCAPVYYKSGAFDVKQRLGCLACPLAYNKKRISQFMQYPKMIKAYARALHRYRETHPHVKSVQLYKDEYSHLMRDIFFRSQKDWNEFNNGMFETDAKTYLENYFNITFNDNEEG